MLIYYKYFPILRKRTGVSLQVYPPYILSHLLKSFFSPVDTPNAPSYARARAHTHTHTQWIPESKKNPTEKNYTEENPEDVKHTNPLTTHPQPN